MASVWALASLAMLPWAAGIEILTRPQSYFGTTSRHPEGINAGIAWGPATSSHEMLRHSCQHEHKLQKWGWTAFGDDGGIEEIGDYDNNITITVHWTKQTAALPACTGLATATISFDRSPAAARRRRKQLQKKQTPDPTLISVFAYVSAGSYAVTMDEGGVVTVDGADSGSGEQWTDNFVLAAAAVSERDEVPSQLRTHVHSPPQPSSLGCPSCSARSVGRVEPGAAWDVDARLGKALGRSYREALLHRLADRDKAVEEAGEGQPPVINWSDVPIVPLLNNTGRSGPSRGGKPHNVALLQMVRSVPFTMTLVYAQAKEGQDKGQCAAQAHEAASGLASMPVEAVAMSAGAAREAFKDQLCGRLGLCTEARGGHGRPVDNSTLSTVSVALANTLGSITYFHGQQVVGQPSEAMEGRPDIEGHKGDTLSQPHGLLTGVPSRSFFPRGFLWDEGFHQLLVSSWDPAASRAVLSSWLGSMDGHGWIAREQILGPEARSRVPEKFRTQRPDIPNPPAIVLPIIALAARGLCGPFASHQQVVSVGPDGPMEHLGTQAFCALRQAENGCRYACEGEAAQPPVSSNGDTLAWLQSVLPRLARHYRWFKTTQAGHLSNTFRWRGATKDHNFASGLDDYPRGVEPHPHDRNVDLLSWMGLFAEVLGQLAAAIGDETLRAEASMDAQRYDSELEAHWNEAVGVYCDIGVSSIQPPPPGSTPGTRGTPVVGQVCHVGYVSIMPLLHRRLSADDPRLGRLLDVLSGPGHLWSQYGLRSLSASSPLFSSGEDYWRGAVWINMNWMAVAALRHYGSQPGPYRERAASLAGQLRERLVSTVVAEYSRTGFLWENYDSAKGTGRGTHPFTGWTALVTLLAADVYPF